MEKRTADMIPDGPLSTKDIVLRELASAKTADGFVSGEDLAVKCGLSRVAVWKAVKTLCRHGVQIQAVKNRGYRLAGTGDTLDADTVCALLPADTCVSVFDTIDSTNTEAKRMCAAAGAVRNADGTLTAAGKQLHRSVIIAGQQTAGRGRMGRSFYSPAQTGIYLSVLYAPAGGVTKPAAMTASAAVAVCRALESLYTVETHIKWVNDIFVSGKKVCGILTEGVTNFETGVIETAIVGIGVNITNGQNGFPEDISHVAGSVLGSVKPEDTAVTRNMLAARIAAEVLAIYDSGVSVMDEYKRRSMVIGQTVTVRPVIGRSGDTYRAEVLDIDSEARLIVKNEKGECLTLQSGEITLHSDTFTQ